MLDIEIVKKPDKTALDIITIDELARHLRLSPTLKRHADVQANLADALTETVAELHGLTGSLNRMILPCTVTRYLKKFPAKGEPIYLPFPNLIRVSAITIEDGSSPPNVVSPSSYVAQKTLIPEVHAKDGWPQVNPGPRAISITYEAGYEEFPDDLRRLIKIRAADAYENPTASIIEQRLTQTSRKIEFGVDQLMTLLRIPVSYDDWGE